MQGVGVCAHLHIEGGEHVSLQYTVFTASMSNQLRYSRCPMVFWRAGSRVNMALEEENVPP